MNDQIGENEFRKDGKFSSVYGNFILTTEEQELLDSKTSGEYNSLFNRNYALTELREYDYLSVKSIISNLFDVKRKNGEHITEFDVRDKANSFSTKIFNDIIEKRNKIISGKFDQYKTIHELENLIKSAQFLSSYQGKVFAAGWTVSLVSDIIKNQASNLVEVLNNDIKEFPEYSARRDETIGRYQLMKAEYDRKSRFGKVVARITGKSKELETARKESMPYLNSKFKSILPEKNPNVVNDHNVQYQFSRIDSPINYPDVVEISEEEGIRR